jgi:hypothetical protein
LRNDVDVFRRQQRQQQSKAATFHQFALTSADDEAGGRFAKLTPTTVIGQSEAARYPKASSAHQTELPPEPPFGVPIDVVERD